MSALRFIFILLSFCHGYVLAATVGPGTVTTPVTESTGGTTTIVGNTTIDTRVAGGNAVNVTNGTIEIGGSNILIESNAIGISVNATSFPAYLNSATGSVLSIITSGASASHGISVTGVSPISGVPLVSLNNASIQTSGSTSSGLLLNNGASAHLSNVNIETLGNNSSGITSPVGGTLSLDNVSIITHGASAGGISTSSSIPVVLNINNLTIDTEGTTAHAIGISASTMTLSHANITSHGVASIGVFLNSGAFANIENSVITTEGNSSVGVSLQVLASSGTISTSSITTRGDSSNGIVFQSGGSLALDNTTVTTEGDASLGFSLLGSSVATYNIGQINTQGTSAHGISLTNNSTLAGDNLSIITIGTTARGVTATSSNVTLNNSRVNTSGTGAHGIGIQGGTFNATNLNVNTTGLNGAGLYITANSLATVANATLSNASIISGQGLGIAISGGTNTVNLTDSNVSSPMYWLHVGQSAATLSPSFEEDDSASLVGLSNATLNINHSTLTGAALTDSGNTSTVSLSNDSLWTMTDSSNLTMLTNTASQIVFTPPLDSQYKTLTVGNYVGQDGLMSLNTFLGTDVSPSDVFVIEGGSATGNTGLIINNTLGAGALTTGNGILVVEAINDGTTAEDSFSLAAPVAAGPYEYLLFQGSVDDSGLYNWYLRSTFNGEPNYRGEVSLYAAVPSNLLLYSRNLVGTFHERVGAEEQVRQDSRAPLYRSFFNGSWIRVLNRQGSINNQGILSEGPAFDYRFYALQAGVDVYHHQYDTGHRDFIGFFGSGGDNRSQVEHDTGELAGNANFKAYGGGVYWTHLTPNGAYLDGVIQANWFDLNASSSSQVLHTSTPVVYAYSLEGGIPIVLGKQWSFEPEAQVVYQSLPGFNGFDQASAVSMNTTDSIIGRLSGRMVWNRDPIATSFPKKRGNMSVWLTPSISYEGLGNSVTRFSSSTEWVPFPSALKGAWFSMDLGTTVQVNTYVSLYGTLLGETYLNGRGRAYNAVLGCRLNL